MHLMATVVPNGGEEVEPVARSMMGPETRHGVPIFAFFVVICLPGYEPSFETQILGSLLTCNPMVVRHNRPLLQ